MKFAFLHNNLPERMQNKRARRDESGEKQRLMVSDFFEKPSVSSR